MIKKKIVLILLCSIFVLPTYAKDFTTTREKLSVALDSDVRTDKEKNRDSNRIPIKTLQFLGLRDTMKVVELIPGGGWYTKLLAPTLRDKGQLNVALGTGRIEKNVLTQKGFDKVVVDAKGSKLYRKQDARLYSLESKGLQMKNADMVLTFRNYHNFDAKGRALMNKIAYDALKNGGIYGVVDHTRRHMEGDTPENRRRIDPVLAIKEIQDAGFILLGYSDLHYRADDQLLYEVGRKSVTGNTDRFTLKFKKVK